ncbi:MAG: hypothetical protein QNJ11_03100 [Woeseiaceae bacterium]|nr:hypothetical protein [Woeseiaceae bacterium]
MTALSRKWSGTDPPRTAHKPCNCVFCGAVAGMVIALAAFFVGSTYYASVAGLCAASCATLGSFMTIALSQPVALAGIVIGAACGGAYACATCRRKTTKGTD